MPHLPHKKIATAREIFSIYLRHATAYPFVIAVVFVGAIGIQVSNLIGPLYLRQFFNVLAGNSPTPAAMTELVGLIGMIALFWLLSWASRRVQDFSTMYLEARVMADLQGTAFGYLIGHSYNFFVSHFAGSLTHRVSKFSRAFEVMFDSIMLQFFPTFVFVAGAVGVLYARNHTLGIVLGIWAVAFVAFQIYLARLRQPVRTARAEADTRVTGVLADAISNHATIMLFAGKEHERGLFRNIVEKWRAATAKSWYTDGAIWGALGFFMMVIEVGLLYGATVYWQQGLLTIGDFVLMQSYLMTMFDRLIAINQELRRFYDAFADAGEMVYVLNTPHEIRDKKGAQPLRVSEGAITFRDVSFYFHETRPILVDFDLAISGHQKVAFVGPSGAGKSTLTKLILRMYDVTKGDIEIDGQNIENVTQDSLREAIAFVPQEPVLFHRSLMENIRYGRRDATDEEVMEASKQAHCHEFISALPEGYGTYVGERGIKLSGGERQRVAIARALLKRSPILVLDEATSSLDSESEALIQDALEVLMRGKTVIVIAHRLSTIMKMDRIVVLEKGIIAADGDHEQLLSQGGLYQKLWSIQAGGFFNDGDEEAGPIEAEEEAAEEKQIRGVQI